MRTSGPILVAACSSFFASPPLCPTWPARVPAIRCSEQLPLEEGPAGDAGSAAFLRTLLTQRAVQTQLHYSEMFKNDFIRAWLANYCITKGCVRLCSEHGSRIVHVHDGMREVVWDEFMLELFNAPEETHEIEVVWGSRIGGGSPNNPYLQDRKQTRTYTDTVRPSLVANQIVAIREVIAREWTRDLLLIAQDNEEVRRHHDEEVVSDTRTDDKENLQYAIRPLEYSDEDGTDCSPLRQASYDLLKNAATAEALRLLTARYLAGDATTERHVGEWLEGFTATYATALVPAKDAAEGAAPRCIEWHAARGVLRSMIAQPVSMGVAKDGSTRFLDPLALAEEMLQLRARIADEWVAACEAAPSEHLELARRRLEQRMFPTTAAATRDAAPPAAESTAAAASGSNQNDDAAADVDADAQRAAAVDAVMLTSWYDQGRRLVRRQGKVVKIASWYDAGGRLGRVARRAPEPTMDEEDADEAPAPATGSVAPSGTVRDADQGPTGAAQ